MSSGQSQNVPELLEQAQAVYRDSAAQLRPGGARLLSQLAGHFAAGVRLGLREPEAMRQLHAAIGGLRDASSLNDVLPRVLDAALSLMGADFGNIQLVDPVSSSLRIVTQFGFNSRFVDYFRVVNDHNSACGRAAAAGGQIVIGDVTADPGFAPHCGIAAASGFRSVQSTPLVDHAGRLVGMVSTHFQRQHRPSEPDLRIMQLYADFAGQAIAEHLGAGEGDHPADPIGRAMISALFDPGDAHLPGVSALSGSASGPGSHRPSSARAAAPDHSLTRFADFVVNRLFRVGLSLATARDNDGQGREEDRLAAAVAEVDHLIHDLQTIMFGQLVDQENDSPERPRPSARLQP